MTKQELINFIDSHPKWYQKIELPGNISTPGRDRSKTVNSIFPKDLTGKTVLDVGCAEGFFSIEAKKRNALNVVGIDFDDDKLKAAKKFSEIQGLEIEFRNIGLDQFTNLDNFDYVVCLNVLHHVTDPLSIINKLVSITNERLILEVANVNTVFSDIGKSKKNKALLGFWGIIFKYLPESLGPGILAVDSRARFLINRKWIKNLIETQYLDIEKLNFLDSELKHRYIVNTKMRHINDLAIISGPTDIGKSSMIKLLKSKSVSTFDLLGIDAQKNWSIMTASALQKSPEKELENLILEYDLCRTVLRRYGVFEQDPILRILRTSDNKNVYTLVCNREDNLNRVKETLDKLTWPKKKDKKKAQRIADEFSQPHKYVSIYEDWIKFCKANNCNLTFIDMCQREGRIVNEEEALRIIKS